jgi:hypothetical protein
MGRGGFERPPVAAIMPSQESALPGPSSICGKTIPLDPDGPLSDAAFLRQELQNSVRAEIVR